MANIAKIVFELSVVATNGIGLSYRCARRDIETSLAGITRNGIAYLNA